MKNYSPNQLTEDIYDLVKECILSNNQNDEWAKLFRKHAEEARKGLHKFLNPKYMEWQGNTIKIGRYITITVTDSRE